MPDVPYKANIESDSRKNLPSINSEFRHFPDVLKLLRRVEIWQGRGRTF